MCDIIISIPQRSDLNTAHIYPGGFYNDISIPQRSDLNPYRYRRVSQPATISIPQRSDLNPGLLKVSFFQNLYFNPATVWFERLSWRDILSDKSHFNPATVWFELSSSACDRHRDDQISIPQRSDLNLRSDSDTFFSFVISIPQRSDLNGVKQHDR